MGDPKQLRKKYNTPRHPWIRANIESEKVVTKEYGLVKKKEIHIANSFIKKYRDIAKRLIATRALPQAQKEKEQILGKLQDLGLLSAGAELEQILGLELKDVLSRRLQSVVYKKGLARSISQARQFITHRHVMVGDQEISSPSYLVSLAEEGTVAFKQKSALADAEHPERVILVKGGTAAPTTQDKMKTSEAAEAPQETASEAK
ncbi:MAG: 30S ribosomal protein S4 [Nanoarchaeota archaeon]